jgi:ubiquinone/menaquinone biosynthesis C-methylase UbiE
MTTTPQRPDSPPRDCTEHQDVRAYYDIAGLDYQAWSQALNMHFGYLRKWSDIFSLEKMLCQLSQVAIGKLKLPSFPAPRVLDMGCGVGAVARQLVRAHPNSTVTGITIVESQVVLGSRICAEEIVHERIELLQQDYESTQFADRTFEAAYAIESMCHAQGEGKAKFVAEMARVLKPGGRFVVLDGFLKKSTRMPYLMQLAYQMMCRCWALPCLANRTMFEDNLRRSGFTNIQMEEISWRVAPSVAHVPFVTLKFLLLEFWRNKSLRLAPQRWNNVAAPVLTMFLGLWLTRVGYFVVSGEKA